MTELELCEDCTTRESRLDIGPAIAPDVTARSSAFQGQTLAHGPVALTEANNQDNRRAM
jgi:hypothetical protein